MPIATFIPPQLLEKHFAPRQYSTVFDYWLNLIIFQFSFYCLRTFRDNISFSFEMNRLRVRSSIVNDSKWKFCWDSHTTWTIRNLWTIPAFRNRTVTLKIAWWHNKSSRENCDVLTFAYRSATLIAMSFVTEEKIFVIIFSSFMRNKSFRWLIRLSRREDSRGRARRNNPNKFPSDYRREWIAVCNSVWKLQ